MNGGGGHALYVCMECTEVLKNAFNRMNRNKQTTIIREYCYVEKT